MANGFPQSDNEYPPLTLPLHGFTRDEQDTMELMRHNALASNEQRGKLEWMLRYLAPFSEEIITGADGMQYFVLAKPTGTQDIAQLDYNIYLGTSAPLNLTNSDILEDYEPAEVEADDNWGILFGVSDKLFTGSYTFGRSHFRFIISSGGTQTGYYLPVIREGDRVSSGGIYQGDSMCVNHVPRAGIIKIG